MENDDKYIFTDYDKTKYLIWDSYTGILHNFNKFNTPYYFNKIDRVSLAGLNKYTNFFFTITRNFFFQQGDRLKEFLNKNNYADIKEVYEQLINFTDKPRTLEYKQFVFLLELATEFMYMSGLMNITFKKDYKSSFAKSQED